MIWMADRGVTPRKKAEGKEQAQGRPLSGACINKVMQAMSVAVRYAVSRGELDSDPFKNIKEAANHGKEKGILSAAEASLIIRAPGQDPRGRLAVLLGLLCGLRLGEVRGLQWGDVGDGLISVCHNYVDGEGSKSPKCGSSRIVPCPASVKAALEEVRKTALNPGPGSLVMESLTRPGPAGGHPESL
jgi:integrase